MATHFTYLDRLAVCSWSLQPEDPSDLVKKVAQTGLHAMQLALDPVREAPLVWGEIGETAAEAGMSIVSGMFRTIGEDYSTLDSIRRTGGLKSDENWEHNWKNIQQNAALAKALELPLVTFHAGFLPRDPRDETFTLLTERLRRVADLFGELGIDLALETGQESAETLNLFLDQLDRDNVGVNFDPANILIYNQGDPIESLKQLLPRLKQCHIKDASRPSNTGEMGKEEAVESGEIDWRLFFITLRKADYKGHLVIEREKGAERIADIQRTVAMVRDEL